jgi:hypothetical protein|tara:strand:- start:19629 stop:20276 length:648 start_codon:yes stop_codon:yes gene_type:complete
MKFKELLEEHNFDYCIVGNSPCEMGKGNGRAIDSHSLVIRFNDFSLDKRYNKDYGKKTNIWIRGTNDFIVYTMKDKKKMINKLDLVVVRACADRNKGFVKYAEKNDLNYDFFKRKYELDLTNRLGLCPSTGLLTLFIINKISGPIDKNRVFGFSFCSENREKDPDGGQVHYYNSGNLWNPYKNRVEKIKNTFLISKHNWKAEESFYKNELLKRKL